MVDFRVVVSDASTGKAYQIEVSETSANAFMGQAIGSEVDGSTVGLSGYTLQITGGSDKGGFPMRRTLPGSKRKKLLVTGGSGFHPDEEGIRKRRSIRGNAIAGDIVQINTVVKDYGASPIESMLGIGGAGDVGEGEGGESPEESAT